MPASAVDGENARMRVRARHRRELKAAVVVAVVVVGYGARMKGQARLFLGQVDLRVV